MIGWIILAAVLAPALMLGRWAERERRRSPARAQSGAGASVPRARRHTLARARRVGATGVRPSAGTVAPPTRGAARRSRTYAGR